MFKITSSKKEMFAVKINPNYPDPNVDLINTINGANGYVIEKVELVKAADEASALAEDREVIGDIADLPIGNMEGALWHVVHYGRISS